MKTEQEMREASVPSLKTIEELTGYINELVDREHDYGTCVYAMSMAATAAFNYVAGALGVTGFQASCADLDIIRRTRHIEGPFGIIDGADLLYPQYDLHAKLDEMIQKWMPWAKEEAIKMLAKMSKEGIAADSVVAHWKKLSEMEFPEKEP